MTQHAKSNHVTLDYAKTSRLRAVQDFPYRTYSATLNFLRLLHISLEMATNGHLFHTKCLSDIHRLVTVYPLRTLWQSRFIILSSLQPSFSLSTSPGERRREECEGCRG